jgi:hypothetical protein
MAAGVRRPPYYIFYKMRKLPVYLCFLVAAMFLSVACSAQDSLVLRKMFNGKIQLLVPGTFRELTSKQIAVKFPDASDRPSVIWARDESSSIMLVELRYDITDEALPDFAIYHANRMKEDPNQEWISDDILKIDGRYVGIIKVIHTDRKRYVHYFYLSIDGKLVLLIYDCDAKLRKALEPLGDRIVASLKVE